jgi:hypothetical protein
MRQAGEQGQWADMASGPANRCALPTLTANNCISGAVNLPTLLNWLGVTWVAPVVWGDYQQGSLPEGEVSVWLTSLYYLV